MQVYRTIFTRCGLKFVAVEADSGAMGGSQSQEFMVYTDAGEDLIASCPACGYAANLEKATSQLEPVTEMEADRRRHARSWSHTPGCAAIADVAAFFKISPASDIKCVAYMAMKRGIGRKARRLAWHGVAAFLRGDHQVNETKLLGVVGGRRPAHHAGRRAGAVLQRPGRITSGPSASSIDATKPLGEDGAHRRRRQVPRRPQEPGLRRQQARLPPTATSFRAATSPGPSVADIRSVNEGEACPHSAASLRGKLVVGKAVEIGHIFKLGYKYSESMGARVLDPNGKEVTPIMGSYGIGIERILTAAIEQIE